MYGSYAQPMAGVAQPQFMSQAAPGGYGGIQSYQPRGQQPMGQQPMAMAPVMASSSYGAPATYGAPTTYGQQPLTPKIATGNLAPVQMQTMSMASPPGTQKFVQPMAAPLQSYSPGGREQALEERMVQLAPLQSYGTGGREQALERRVRELESLLGMKEKTIQELQAALGSGKGGKKGSNSQVRSPGRAGSGFRKVNESKPVIRYNAQDQDDPIDVRLEEFYNSTGSAIQFRRINRGFYRFGDSIVELDIINHKLMARTEDGWNRGKFGPVEKFLMYYENIEREKAGILPES